LAVLYVLSAKRNFIGIRHATITFCPTSAHHAGFKEDHRQRCLCRGPAGYPCREAPYQASCPMQCAAAGPNAARAEAEQCTGHCAACEGCSSRRYAGNAACWRGHLLCCLWAPALLCTTGQSSLVTALYAAAHNVHSNTQQLQSICFQLLHPADADPLAYIPSMQANRQHHQPAFIEAILSHASPSTL
jgi:hypothetical protein